METIKLNDLKKKIPYKWKIQMYSKKYPECTCVAYIDSRDVMELLDEVCGIGGWRNDFKEVKGQMMCGIGIKIDNEWIYKWDTGSSESDFEKEKSLASDSFKRAAVHWGIGRFLYDLDMVKLETDQKKESNNYPYPVDKQGGRIWDITKHIMENQKGNNRITIK